MNSVVCKNYDKKIESMGGIDLQVLKIVHNGHVGFNEPDGTPIGPTHLTSHTQRCNSIS